MTRRFDTASLSTRAQREIMRIIKGMDLDRGNKLPREESLAELLGVSRTTVRQALNNLAAEGIVFRRQGRGTFVNVDSLGVRATFSPSMEMLEAIRNSGHEASARLLGLRLLPAGPVADDVRAALRIPAEEPVVELDKVFCADGSPAAFCRDQLALSSVGGECGFGELSTYEDSVYKFVFAKSGRRVEWDKAELDVASPDDIRALGGSFAEAELSARPYLLVRSICYDRDDLPFMYGYEWVDTSVVTFDLIRQKSVDYSDEF